MKKNLVLATRQSPLALAQVEKVQEKIFNSSFQGNIEVLSQQTQGDKDLSSPLFHKGGKGLFIREIEQNLLNGTADIAVHSLKDLPLTSHQDLTLAGFLSEGHCQDVLISREENLTLDSQSRVGTSSLRRASQLKLHYPQINLEPIRGSVGRRLEKLRQGSYTHTLLALAGLKRLNIELDLPYKILCPKDEMIPAFSQGIIALQIRRTDTQLKDFLQSISCPLAAKRQYYERLIASWFEATCQSAFGCYVQLAQKEQASHQAFIFAYQSNKKFLQQKIMFSTQDELHEKVHQQYSLGNTSWALCQEKFFLHT